MRYLMMLVAAAAFLITGPLSAQDTERYGTQQVVYHINSPGGDENRYYFGSMRNVQNHINAVCREP
jgi:hypothetical protein